MKNLKAKIIGQKAEASRSCLTHISFICDLMLNRSKKHQLDERHAF